MGKKDDQARALAAVKKAKVSGARTFAEADRRMKEARRLYGAARKDRGK